MLTLGTRDMCYRDYMTLHLKHILRTTPSLLQSFPEITSHPILNHVQFRNYRALKIYGDFLPFEIFFFSYALTKFPTTSLQPRRRHQPLRNHDPQPPFGPPTCVLPLSPALLIFKDVISFSWENPYCSHFWLSDIPKTRRSLTTSCVHWSWLCCVHRRPPKSCHLMSRHGRFRWGTPFRRAWLWPRRATTGTGMAAGRFSLHGPFSSCARSPPVRRPASRRRRYRHPLCSTLLYSFRLSPDKSNTVKQKMCQKSTARDSGQNRWRCWQWYLDSVRLLGK